MTPRSWLFAPADSPAKIAKASGSGADAVILDLEDSVALANKPDARHLAAAALANRPPSGPSFWVRINSLASGIALADLAAIMPSSPAGIVLPKPDSAADVQKLGLYLDAFEAASSVPPGSTKILPIATETAASVFNLGTYASCGPRLAGLTWGAEDLPAAIGASTNRDESGALTDICRLARSLCLAGAAGAGVAAIDTVFADFRDHDALHAWASAGRREGFSGMLAIHPSQIPIINAVMTPNETEIAQAERIVALFAANPGAGVLALDGKMLDLPHLKQARQVLARLPTLPVS